MRFCFVDQMPPKMRDTLYVKDDDYRLSFLTGSYITLTNLREEDLERICRLHLSPLYVSVHATDLKSDKVMRNRHAGKLLSLMERLAACGIQFHTQVVLCPGLNDGLFWNKPLLIFLHFIRPRTLAVVPVGLTGYRQGLYSLQSNSLTDARKVLKQIHAWQEKTLKKLGHVLFLPPMSFILWPGAPFRLLKPTKVIPSWKTGRFGAYAA